jgi:hypothetical protein
LITVTVVAVKTVLTKVITNSTRSLNLDYNNKVKKIANNSDDEQMQYNSPRKYYLGTYGLFNKDNGYTIFN